MGVGSLFGLEVESIGLYISILRLLEGNYRQRGRLGLRDQGRRDSEIAPARLRYCCPIVFMVVQSNRFFGFAREDVAQGFSNALRGINTRIGRL